MGLKLHSRRGLREWVAPGTKACPGRSAAGGGQNGLNLRSAALWTNIVANRLRGGRAPTPTATPEPHECTIPSTDPVSARPRIRPNPMWGPRRPDCAKRGSAALLRTRTRPCAPSCTPTIEGLMPCNGTLAPVLDQVTASSERRLIRVLLKAQPLCPPLGAADQDQAIWPEGGAPTRQAALCGSEPGHVLPRLWSAVASAARHRFSRCRRQSASPQRRRRFALPAHSINRGRWPCLSQRSTSALASCAISPADGFSAAACAEQGAVRGIDIWRGPPMSRGMATPAASGVSGAVCHVLRSASHANHGEANAMQLDAGAG